MQADETRPARVKFFKWVMEPEGIPTRLLTYICVWGGVYYTCMRERWISKNKSCFP